MAPDLFAPAPAGTLYRVRCIATELPGEQIVRAAEPGLAVWEAVRGLFEVSLVQPDVLVGVRS